MRRRDWWLIILASAAGASVANQASADAGRDSGTPDASRDASSGGVGGSGGSSADARAGSSGGGSAGRGGSDARAADANAPDGDAASSLVGTSAVACGTTATFNSELYTPCTDVCDTGWCVLATDVPTQASGLPYCADPTYKCVPQFLIQTNSKVRFKSCRSVGHVEGRCLPQCLPAISGQPLPLPQDDCLPNERCLPCFNPIDGTDNGVCSYECDPGPQQEPATFPGCCGTEGVCLDATLIGPQDQARLQKESCGKGQLCAPKNPLAPSFSCEVIGGEPSLGTGGSGSGGAPATGGSTLKPDAGKKTAPAAADDSGCGCRVATNDHENIAPLLALVGAAALARRRRVIV